MPDGGTRRHCRRLPGPATLDAAARTVTAVLATSEPVARETYYEILEMTASAADLSRQPFPLLVDHNNRTEDVIGVVDDVRIAAGELIGRLHFDETPRAEEVWQRVGRGMLGHVSVSYIRHRDKADGSLDGVPRRRATRWELVEISIVGAPADGNARIRAIGGTSMTDSQAVTAGDASDPLPVADNPDIDDSAVASRAVRAERRRIGEIQKLARATGFADQAVVTEIIESGASVETARKRLWDGLAARSANIGCFGSSQWGDAAVNHEDQAIIEALAGRMSGRPGAGNPWSSRSLLDIARHRLERGGINTRTLSKEDVFFPGRGSWFARRAAGVHTSSDFPLLLSAAASKALATIFAAVESPLKQIARRNDRGDFKAGSMINIGAFPALEEVPEAGEIKLGTVDESAESWKLKSYGKRFALSFQAMVNDDLGQFSDWSRMCAISAAQAEGDVLFALLSANSYAGSTLSDNVALFDAAHSNLASPGTAFDVTNFGAAVAALRQQRALGATAALGVAPKFVLCGPKKELQVRQVLSATIVPNTAGAVNPWAGVVQPLIEPRFAARSDWYAFADASVWPVLEYGYLSDQAGPQVQTQEGWQTLSIECRLVLHFGAGVVDYRGAYRNPGA